jgi:hypothetical protein
VSDRCHCLDHAPRVRRAKQKRCWRELHAAPRASISGRLSTACDHVHHAVAELVDPMRSQGQTRGLEVNWWGQRKQPVRRRGARSSWLSKNYGPGNETLKQKGLARLVLNGSERLPNSESSGRSLSRGDPCWCKHPDRNRVVCRICIGTQPRSSSIAKSRIDHAKVFFRYERRRPDERPRRP